MREKQSFTSSPLMAKLVFSFSDKDVENFVAFTFTAEVIASLLFLYITITTIIRYTHQSDPTLSTPNTSCEGVGILDITWAFDGMIFILVCCNACISDGHINPTVTQIQFAPFCPLCGGDGGAMIVPLS